jgi:Lar family restriction alleviation protein
MSKIGKYELLHCPFCGSDDIMLVDPNPMSEGKYSHVRCRNCYIGTGCEDSRDLAVEKWNRRV